MNGIKKSLYDLMNEELKELNLKAFPSLDKFIKSDEESAEFIRTVLHEDDYELPKKGDEIFDFAKTRARHSAVTYLVGLVFLRIFRETSAHSRENHAFSNTKEADRLWLITSLYHDAAYFSKLILDERLDYKKKYQGKNGYYLLTDQYKGRRMKPLLNFSETHKEFFAHTYKQILAYDKYAREYHKRKNDPVEKVDHGILGGVMTFDKLVKKVLKKAAPTSDADLIAIKSSCLTIAQHNIFKSGKKGDDPYYPAPLEHLHHDSDFRINSNTPLLLFLCFVDTIECVKRFSKGEQEKLYLQTMTVLSSVKLEFVEHSLVLDCSDLHRQIESKGTGNEKLLNDYKKYINAVLTFDQWTAFSAKQNKENEFVITFAERYASNRDAEKLAG